MIGAMILSLLCLALLSVASRVILFFRDRRDGGRPARVALITGSIGFLPIIVFEWACSIAMFALLLLCFAYLIAPERVTGSLNGTFS
jgi:hypothetical protein